MVEVVPSDSLKRATCTYRSRRAASAAAAVTGFTAAVSKTDLLADCLTVSVFRWAFVTERGLCAWEICYFKAWLNCPEDSTCSFLIACC
jgi:hypothetical protein